MIDSALLLEELMKKANEQSDTIILNKLKDNNFIKSLNNVIDVLHSLGFYIGEGNNLNVDDKQKDIYLKIASALVRNFFTTYYINVNSGLYVGYSSNDDYKTLRIEENGTNFFKDVKKNIPNNIYKDDQEKLYEIFDKNFLLKETHEGKIFKHRYRLLLNNNPTYVTLTAIRITNEDLIIGLNNVDEITKKEIDIHNSMKENLTYTNIALSLCINYFGVYYVNTLTDEYEQYKVDSQTQKIEKIEEGKDFFYVSTINAKKLIFKEDLDNFLYSLDKKHLLNELKTNHSFNMTYRQLIDGVPTYVSFKAVNLTSDKNHIVIAISNIDKQKRKENDYKSKIEKEKLYARTDGLTGCYNRNYYLEVEEDINHKINNKTIKEFAAAQFDINDLKTINDTLGHEAGDKYIIDATNLISSHFKESLLFRTGGDEFVVIINGNDYKHREKIIKNIINTSKKNKLHKKVVVACGYSDFNYESDTSLNDVVKRADELMYENKKELKQ